MPFKHGRLTSLWLGANDVSSYFSSADWDVKVAAAETTTFGSSYKTFIPGAAESTLSASGYYDSVVGTGGDDAVVQATLQVADAIITYFPAGAIAIGDNARLIQANSTELKRGSKVGGAVTFDWNAQSDQVAEQGTLLVPMTTYNTGAAQTLGGDGLSTGVSSSTGLIAHLHVVSCSAGSNTFKLQDATTLGGAYTDIASGAFSTFSAPGVQRLVVPGTIRAFVRVLFTVATSSAVFGVSAART